MIRRVCFSVAVGLLILLAAAGTALATTLTFGELPSQPVNELSFMGVTFGFTVGRVGSSDARYNSIGPGNLTFVQDPSLEGNAAGILTVDFAVRTTVLLFGVALSTFSPLTPGVTVELF